MLGDNIAKELAELLKLELPSMLMLKCMQRKETGPDMKP